MKTISVILVMAILLFEATEAEAGEWKRIFQRASGVVISVLVHEGGHMINTVEGQNQYWQVRNIASLTAFTVEPGYDISRVTRHASMSGIVTGTKVELLVSSTKLGTDDLRYGLTLGTAAYQAGYPIATMLGLGVDISQYEKYGGSKASKFGLLAIGSYKFGTLVVGHDPLSDGKGWEFTPSYDSDGIFWANCARRF